MKKIVKVISFILLFLVSFSLTSCGLLSTNNDNVHTSSYDAITGKFILYQAIDPRINYEDTYFVIDGSEKNFSIKYYEKGQLKKEGVFNKIITYTDRIGYWTDNLHFNIKCGDSYEHIGAYTETFDPINQFRIIEEYSGGKNERKYYYSELPFVMGTYVREGASYIEESKNINKTDYTVPTLENYTSELDGKYQLDNEHYFYFISPKAFVSKDGPYMDSYFQYYAPNLSKPIEGFVHGVTYKDSYAPPRLHLSYSIEPSYYESLEDTVNALMFGYTTFKQDQTMVEHWGSIDFSNGKLNSFSFEHLSRSWTDEEWNKYMDNSDYFLPDAIIYDYKGGTYTKVYN